jgi:mRNA interferase RelE/StbE
LAYRVEYKYSVGRELKKLDKKVVKRLLGKVERTLGEDPQAGEPLGGKLRGLRKLRVGDYRVIFMRFEDVIIVLKIGHRKGVYK